MMINRAPSTASSETLHCLGTTQDQLEMTQFSQQHKYFNDFSMFSFLEQPTQGFQGGLLLESGDDLLNELAMNRPIKADPGLEPGWPDFRASATPAAMDDYSAAAAHGLVNYGISRTSSCPPASMADKMRTETFRKRKADNKTLQPSKEEAGDENWAKKSKRCCEEDELAPKKPDEHLSNSGNKENKMKEGLSGGSSSKASEAQKPDYIHVRARRGQATDSHSLAERVRREKISVRMKYLQDLVPGCNKITGKAGMLDEIINYVQSLQRQVEFLSMKLAVVNPWLDFNIEDLFAKEVFSACSSNIPEMDMGNMAYLQYNSGQQTGPVCGSGFSVTEAEMGIQRTFSATVPIPEALPDSSSLTQLQSCLPWDQPDLQSIYNMEFQRASQPSFSTQTYTGPN